MKLNTKVLYRKFSSKLEFYKNRLSDSHTLHNCESSFIPALSTFLDRFWGNSIDLEKISTTYTVGHFVSFVKLGAVTAIL
jgi:hypothetical protein